MADSFCERIVTLILALLAALLCVGLGVCRLFTWGLSSSLSRPSIWSLVTGTESKTKQHFYKRLKVGRSLHNFNRGWTFKKLLTNITDVFWAINECCSAHSDFEAHTHKLVAMGTRKRSEKDRRKRKEGQTLTKYTRRGARRKIFPHKHVLFHKSSKLSWNELEGKKPEGRL